MRGRGRGGISKPRNTRYSMPRYFGVMERGTRGQKGTTRGSRRRKRTSNEAPNNSNHVISSGQEMSSTTRQPSVEAFRPSNPMHLMLQQAILAGQFKRSQEYKPKGFDRLGIKQSDSALQPSHSVSSSTSSSSSSLSFENHPTPSSSGNSVIRTICSPSQTCPPALLEETSNIANSALSTHTEPAASRTNTHTPIVSGTDIESSSSCSKQFNLPQTRTDLNILRRIPLLVCGKANPAAANQVEVEEESIRKTLLATPGHHRCFYDLGEFDGVPVLLPTRYIANRDTYVINPHHKYCSFGCAKRALVEKQDALQQMRLTWFADLARRFYGIGYRKRIICAPSRETLDIFGGPYSLEEFRSKSVNGISTDVVRAPLVFETSLLYEYDSHTARAHVTWLRNNMTM